MYDRLHFHRLACMFMLIAGTAACAADASRSGSRVEIVRNSGLKQCGEETPSPEAFAKLLRDNGVEVFSSTCASDGAMRAQFCGADRGLFYVYEIDAAALPKALELGFTDVRRMPEPSRFRRFPCTRSGAPGPGSIPNNDKGT